MVLLGVNTFFKIFLIIFIFMWNKAAWQAWQATQKVEIPLFNFGVTRSTWNNTSDASDAKSRISTFILGAIEL